MSVRDSLARRFTGGPPFQVRPDEILVELDLNGSSVGDRITEQGKSGEIIRNARNQFQELGFQVREFRQTGVMLLKADRLTDVLDRIQEAQAEFSQSVVSGLTRARESASALTNRTIVGGYSAGEAEFGSTMLDSEDEAAIRNFLTDLSLHNELTEAIEEVEGVVNAQMRYTRVTYGPRSLRVDPGALRSVLPEQLEEETQAVMPEVLDLINIEEAWETTTGENAILAVFDTGFCEDFFDESRILDTFSGDSVDSAFSDHAKEGHGSMTAVSAAGNTDEGAPVDGPAKGADLFLIRVTDSDHALSNVEEGLDWLAGKLEEVDRPVISNHSYGVPFCSGRVMQLCGETSFKVARQLSLRDDHQAIYAAGNEADYCGRRLSGVTNGISGINSDDSSITVGALRSSGNEAQRYSSHGYGTCHDENPKPDVSAPIPQILPYGCSTRDMTSGIGGSSGGTSTASPITAGVATLIASVTGTAEQDVIEGALEETAELPRPTQINLIGNNDARFGNGMINAQAALESVTDN